MPGRNNPRKNVFCSMSEIEKEFLPKSYKEIIQKANIGKPGVFGSELADDLLRRIKKSLNKKS